MEGMVAAVAQRTRSKTPLEAVVAQLRDGVHAMSDWIRQADGQDLGEGLIQIREAGIDSLEAVFADGLRRFDESGDWARRRNGYRAWRRRRSACRGRVRVAATRHKKQGQPQLKPPCIFHVASRSGQRSRWVEVTS